MDKKLFLECVDVEMSIKEAFQTHVQEFRVFAEKTNAWLVNYEQLISPMLMNCLEGIGTNSPMANWQLLNDLTRHAEAFANLTQQALAEYEEAYKTAHAIFNKMKST